MIFKICQTAENGCTIYSYNVVYQNYMRKITFVVSLS